MVPAAVHAVEDEEDVEDDHLDDHMDEGNFNEDVMDEGYQQAEQNDNIKIPSKLEVAPPPKCGLGDGWMEWVIPLRLLRLLEHLRC